MSSSTLSNALGRAPDPRELARALGAICLDNAAEIARQRAALPTAREHIHHLAQAVAAIPEAAWAEAFAGGTPEGLLDAPYVRPAVELLGASPPLAELAFLRGMCWKILPLIYARVAEPVALRYGDPFPLPERPRPTAIDRATPRPTTLAAGHMLEQTGFRLFDRPTDSPLRCVLDFSARHELDAVTWIGDHHGGELPLVATVHPYASSVELEVAEVNDSWWFGVGPKEWKEDGVLDQLAVAAEASCAVITELALPEPGALARALAERYADFPALVVAGSAHVSETDEATPPNPVRANEAVVYLKGAELLRHRKVHPFVAKYLDSATALETRLPEGITPEPKTITVAAGTYTRLAAVICADLNDEQIPDVLRLLCVNLLLVPALSVHDGAFNGTAALLASHCQGVTVIANGSPVVPPGSAEEAPFMVMAGVPRLDPSEQTTLYGEPSTGRRAVGMFDPNQRLAEGLTWIA